MTNPNLVKLVEECDLKRRILREAAGAINQALLDLDNFYTEERRKLLMEEIRQNETHEQAT